MHFDQTENHNHSLFFSHDLTVSWRILSKRGRLVAMIQVAGLGLPKSVLFEERDMTKDGANTETRSKNIDYDFTKKILSLG